MKEHLAGIKGDVAPCTMVPSEVKSEISEFMKKKYGAKKVAQLYREERIDQCASLHPKSFGSSNSSVSQRRSRGPKDRFLVNIEEGVDDENVRGPSQGSVQDLRNRTVQDIGNFFLEWHCF